MIPSLSMWPFALAGLAFAVGPIVIHLLNRRRFRVVDWAAMDFLLEAMKRSRRIMHLRDIVLLVIRTAAVLLFGLALAQPFFASSSSVFDGQQPLHAVLLIDNSRSMGYLSMQGTLLDAAKDRARGFIEQLPGGSRITVLPVCGSTLGASPDPYDTKDHAIDALNQIRVVDRSAGFQDAVNEATRAAQSAAELSKRIVLFTDQQRNNWLGFEKDAADKLPEMQVVEVRADEVQNTWIADLRVQDGLADVETPTTIIVEVQHSGDQPRYDLEVKLLVEGVETAGRTITLEPGAVRELAFEHVFQNVRPEPGKPVFVPVSAQLTPDRLAADDRRDVVVSVVAALPVVFVDQYGADEEDVIQHRVGETRHLRQLLAPRTRRDDSARQLVRIRHIRIDELNQDLLADARLVVMAGVADPGEATQLLREYVEQGGPLLIAAGADFDPAAWNEAAWLKGAGVLPAPLKPDFLGATPEEARDSLQPFSLAYESLTSHEYFQLAGESEERLRDLFAEPFFFKTTRVDVSPDAMKSFVSAEVARLERVADLRAAYEEALKNDGDAARGQTIRDYQDAHPEWLLWGRPQADSLGDDVDAPGRKRNVSASRAKAIRPAVLASFDNGLPYLVERKIGRGRVLFAASGLLSGWNTLPKTNCIVIFDRMLRAMIEGTLPTRNFDPLDQVFVDLPSADREIKLSLNRPSEGAPSEIIHTGFLDRGASVLHPYDAGLYELNAYSAEQVAEDEDAIDDVVWREIIAVQAAPAESELRTISQEEMAELVGESQLRVVGPSDSISLAGSQIRGQDTWWWLALAVLVLLLAELLVLVLPGASWRNREVATR